MRNEKAVNRGDRVYNGLPSKTMNEIYDGLKARIDNFPQSQLPTWDIFSLYLARSCGKIENQLSLASQLAECLNELFTKELINGQNVPSLSWIDKAKQLLAEWGEE